VDPLDAYSARQSRLQSSLGFGCSCAQCSLAPDERDASDANLQRIKTLEAELSDFSNADASTDLVEELLGLYRMERLDAKLGGAYTMAALGYALFGVENRAREYANLAAEAMALEYGEDMADVGAMRELAKNPKAHWAWKQRA
jgi:hypothetical protein